MPKTSRRTRTPAPRIVIVASRYNATITDALCEGAQRAFENHAPQGWELGLATAPGAFELPAICLAAAQLDGVVGVLAVGCIVKGETIHDEVIAHAVAKGLIDITLATGVPVSLAVLTVNTQAQAVARAGGKQGTNQGNNQGNKGEEAMLALLETASLLTGTEFTPVQSPDKFRKGLHPREGKAL